LAATTQLGRSVLVQVISPNGVNTAVTVTDVATGRQFVPLVVQYPIVKSGNITETAYYTSAHPALLSAEVISAGNSYVTTMLETAAERLADKGRSEEHTSELQSRGQLVCRLLLEKKKAATTTSTAA